VGRVAHAIAQESSYVTADVVEVQEFPRLAQAYGVRGVPQTVINNSVSFTGAVTEAVFVQRVLEAVGVDIAQEDSQDGDSSDSTPLA
jgi:predicted DsbA family dithiol-disulfide isomerase